MVSNVSKCLVLNCLKMFIVYFNLYISRTIDLSNSLVEHTQNARARKLKLKTSKELIYNAGALSLKSTSKDSIQHIHNLLFLSANVCGSIFLTIYRPRYRIGPYSGARCCCS